MAKHINNAGLEIVRVGEGLRLGAYRDVAGIWTIGYGHTCPDVRAGMIITEAQANDLLRADLAKAEEAVEGATQEETTDNQFSAMVSLAFNVGTAAFHKSTVLASHRAANYAGAAQAFLLWDKAHVNGKLIVVPGLLKRRMQERGLYLAGTQDIQIPPWPVAKVAVAPSFWGRISRWFGA